MRSRGLMVLACLLGTLPTVQSIGRAQTSGLAAVRWLAVCWELRSGNRVILEMWMPPDGLSDAAGRLYGPLSPGDDALLGRRCSGSAAVTC
jgi:hypothetical protein